RTIKILFASLFFLLLQVNVVQLLTIDGISPDLLIIWIVYLALTEGQLRSTLWGFSIGLAFDFVTGNFIGLSALTKTVCGFLAGYFFNENKTQLILGSYRILLIVLFVSLIHNTVYFIVFTRGTTIGVLGAILQIGLATTVYTATITLLPMFIFARKMVS
ncbi:MAG TPA: rod shape-determining protein MreD, partial [Bacteroidota bacterium]|nr:rod shape-determining protein MreD [Bacteroidota bacterium]